MRNEPGTPDRPPIGFPIEETHEIDTAWNYMDYSLSMAWEFCPAQTLWVSVNTFDVFGTRIPSRNRYISSLGVGITLLPNKSHTLTEATLRIRAYTSIYFLDK